MTYTNCGSKKRRGFFEFMDEMFVGDFKGFAQKFKDFGEEFRKEFRESMGRDYVENFALMNVIENAQTYRVEVAAPGLSKESFKISLQEDRLHISADLETVLAEGESYRRREYDFGKFQRSYPLPEDADTDKIEAKYEDGVLKISIPKRVKAQEDEREIKIS